MTSSRVPTLLTLWKATRKGTLTRVPGRPGVVAYHRRRGAPLLLSPRGAARPLKQKAIRRNAPPRSPQIGERLYVRRVIIGRKD